MSGMQGYYAQGLLDGGFNNAQVLELMLLGSARETARNGVYKAEDMPLADAHQMLTVEQMAPDDIIQQLKDDYANSKGRPKWVAAASVGLAAFLGLGGIASQADGAPMEIKFTNSLSGDYADDTFHAETKDGAVNDYGLMDVLQPGGPPTGKYTQMRSRVDGHNLTKDVRAPLEDGVQETWQVKLRAAGDIEDEDLVSGIGTIQWDYTDVPDDIELRLIDYGMDSSRTVPIAIIDMGADLDNKYTFDVSREGPGTYRYVDFTVPEPATLALLALGGSLMIQRRKAKKR